MDEKSSQVPKRNQKGIKKSSQWFKRAQLGSKVLKRSHTIPKPKGLTEVLKDWIELTRAKKTSSYLLIFTPLFTFFPYTFRNFCLFLTSFTPSCLCTFTKHLLYQYTIFVIGLIFLHLVAKLSLISQGLDILNDRSFARDHGQTYTTTALFQRLSVACLA